jgi:hypothetical protein
MNDYSHSSSAWRTAHALNKSLRLRGHLPPLYTKPLTLNESAPLSLALALAVDLPVDLPRPPAPVTQEL